MSAGTGYDYVKAHRQKRLAAGDKQLNTWMVKVAADAMQELLDATDLTREEIVAKALLMYRDERLKK
ncbi:hypothetical protein PEp14_00056 [Erwinia phage PEp14]|uniref:Uncharacterized protein n=1 Tax=Erwinia phage PEp14 TaxID=1131315 RepID=H2DE86_9CAUD|nr:hypothetical protein PEp14_00056 [Erwinia phage PEp14]AEY69645.1 hypothetical protein PEp14_00056 [Erwinia phage PEp14]